ncbi:hypothetical protein SNE510_64250 [Streptomyces sp. NE5-10]|nr:hypothetical protein SNE510_64250 [Streptomyces sp. NE5-10]
MLFIGGGEDAVLAGVLPKSAALPGFPRTSRTRNTAHSRTPRSVAVSPRALRGAILRVLVMVRLSGVRDTGWCGHPEGGWMIG